VGDCAQISRRAGRKRGRAHRHLCRTHRHADASSRTSSRSRSAAWWCRTSPCTTRTKSRARTYASA
jgi:hypothetical protein